MQTTPTEGRALFDTLGVDDTAAGVIPYVMVASFCGGRTREALDNLPIWKMYGDDARGISLLFKTDDIIFDTRGHGTWTYNPLEKHEKSDKNPELDTTDATDEKDEKDAVPPQILYKVHYRGTSNEQTDAQIDTHIETITKQLKKIEEEAQKKLKDGQKTHEKKREDLQKVYKKTLGLLSGVRYLIKDASYRYENEYRLLCFVGEEHIPDVLKCKDIQMQGEDEPRVYVEADILEKLCAVITGPKLSTAQVLSIQYRLQRYKKDKQLEKLEDTMMRRSGIPYQ